MKFWLWVSGTVLARNKRKGTKDPAIIVMDLAAGTYRMAHGARGDAWRMVTIEEDGATKVRLEVDGPIELDGGREGLDL